MSKTEVSEKGHNGKSCKLFTIVSVFQSSFKGKCAWFQNNILKNMLHVFIVHTLQIHVFKPSTLLVMIQLLMSFSRVLILVSQ